MASVHAELAALLTGIRRPGDFFASGEMEIFPPRIEVEGVGVVALPLLPLQAQQLIAVAERAPYGKGEETITDTAVRRTWQIAPDRIRIEGRHWAATLATILERVAETFGVTDPIEAAPYKMLLYDAGSFFVSHRDTEKEPGMFATLVIVLPSLSTGGTLVARHKGREVRFDPRCDHPSQIAYAAFYADCVHEVLPVTSGCRMVMVYNLRRKGRGPVPLPPDYDNEQTRVAACLRLWAEATREEGTTARDATAFRASTRSRVDPFVTPPPCAFRSTA